MNRLLNLWEIMNLFDVYTFNYLIVQLFSHLQITSRSDADISTKAQAELVSSMLTKLQLFCHELDKKGKEFGKTYRATERVIERLRIKPEVPQAAIHEMLMHVHDAMVTDLKEHRFLYIAPALTSYLDREDLFGIAVQRAFPSARLDLREAGNCLAIGSSTAAVFHLMRVAEYGLRSIAVKLKVKLKNKGANQPIEYADWNAVITGIRNAIAATRQLPLGKRKEAQLEFYSNMADHCEFIKDIWRNNISHTRKHYNQPEALGVFARIEEFMNKIAIGKG